MIILNKWEKQWVKLSLSLLSQEEKNQSSKKKTKTLDLIKIQYNQMKIQ